jgi:hypothetical protein
VHLALGERLNIRQVALEISMLAVLHGNVEPPRALVPAVRLDEEFRVLVC